MREELENDLVKLWNESIQNWIFKKLRESSANFRYSNGNNKQQFGIIQQSYKIRRKILHYTEIGRIYDRTCEKRVEKSKVAFQGSKIEIAAQFVTSGILSVYQHWFNSDRNVPLEELSKEIGGIVLYGIKSLER